MRKGRLIALLPPERVHDSCGDGCAPKVGDIVELDQGFTFPDGRPGGSVYCLLPDGRIKWEADVYDSEIQLIATHAVSVQITGYVGDSFPGMVSCTLRDAHEHTWQFMEKVPIVSVAHLKGDSTYPQRGEIRCEVRSRCEDAAGRTLVRIDTGLPDGVKTVDGRRIFDVLAEQLVEIPGDA